MPDTDDIQLDNKSSPLPCERMTRGIKRLMEQGESLSTEQEKEGQVIVEIRRVDGKKHVRISRSTNKHVHESKQSNDETNAESSDEVEKKSFTEGLHNVSNLLCNIINQIRNKCLPSSPNERKLLSSAAVDKKLGISL